MGTHLSTDVNDLVNTTFGLRLLELIHTTQQHKKKRRQKQYMLPKVSPMAISFPMLFVIVAFLTVCTFEEQHETIFDQGPYMHKDELLEGGSCVDKTFSSDGVTSKHASCDFCPREVSYSLGMFINNDGAIRDSLDDLPEMSTTSGSLDQVVTAYPKTCTTIVVTGGVKANGTSEVCVLSS